MNDTTLFDTIKTAVIEIDNELVQLNGSGVYFAPEQYIAFFIGKAILKNRISIFGSDNVEWIREKKLGEKGQDSGYSGITDIVFRVSDRTIAIELKLRSTQGKYKADIEKLSRLPDNYDKYFCVLLDSFTESNDIRVINLQNEYSEKISSAGHHSFSTWNNWYKSQVHCNLNLFSILSNRK